MIRVLLVDDHRLLRVAVRTIFADAEGIEVVGEARDGREALQLVEACQPHVLITDIAMPGLNGLELAARVTKEFPQVRVIILSMHTAEEYVWQALQHGVSGYLLKDSEPAEMCFAVQAVARGDTYLTPQVSKHVIANYFNRLDLPATPLDLLTSRQRETLQLLAEGHSTKEIARLLAVSVKTVETYRTQIMERLDIHDFAGLIRFAIRVGLVPSGL